LEKSHLYFTKQPFDPETVFHRVSGIEQFFAHFYGTPNEMMRPLIDLPGLFIFVHCWLYSINFRRAALQHYG
jgi:hypothetical protein